MSKPNLQHYAVLEDLLSTKKGILLSEGGRSIILPLEWRKALLRMGVPLIVFTNQAIVAEGDYKKLAAITKRFKELREETLKEIRKDGDLFDQVKPTLQYYKIWRRRGALPKNSFRKPNWEAQVKISDIIVRILNQKVGEEKAQNTSYDMYAGLDEIGNCLIVCLYYLSVARSLGLNAELYAIPQHSIVGLTGSNSVQYVDPSIGYPRVEKTEPVTFEFEGGKEITIDYTNPQKIDVYGLTTAWTNKGSVLLDIGKAEKKPEKFEDAEKAFDKALEINPSYVQAWYGKGAAIVEIELLKRDKKNREKLEEAYECFQKTLYFGLSDELVWERKGLVLLELDKTEEAINAFEQALKMNPNSINSLNGKARALSVLAALPSNRKKAHKLLEDALRIINKAIEIKQKDDKLWNNKGVMLLRLELFEDAADAFEQALKINPKNNNAKMNLITARSKSQDSKK